MSETVEQRVFEELRRMTCISAVRRVMEEAAPLWLESADAAVFAYLHKHFPTAIFDAPTPKPEQQE